MAFVKDVSFLFRSASFNGRLSSGWYPSQYQETDIRTSFGTGNRLSSCFSFSFFYWRVIQAVGRLYHTKRVGHVNEKAYHGEL